MKKLLITLLLISPFSFADWAITYKCDITHFTMGRTMGGRGLENLGKEYKNQIDKSFKFQTSQTVRGKVVRFDDAAFSSLVMHNEMVVTNWKTDAKTSWIGTAAHGNYRSTVAFEEGQLIYNWVSLGQIGTNSVWAKCKEVKQ